MNEMTTTQEIKEALEGLANVGVYAIDAFKLAHYEQYEESKELLEHIRSELMSLIPFIEEI